MRFPRQSKPLLGVLLLIAISIRWTKDIESAELPLDSLIVNECLPDKAGRRNRARVQLLK